MPYLRVIGDNRVWILTSVVATVALVLTQAIRDLPPLDAPIHVAWPVLIPLVYLAEVTVVHLQFRKDAHSFSMSEIPIVVGLFFMDPIGLIGAQLVGNALALGLHRRQPAIKLTFNLSQFTLQAALSVIVFRSILGERDPQGAAGWIGIVVTIGLVVVVARLLINVAIRLTGGELDRSEQLTVLKLSIVAALMNASLGLVAITVMWTRSSAAWAAAVPPVILYLAYRAYLAQVVERQRLQALYEATKELHSSIQIEGSMMAAAAHARSMFEAERALIAIFPGGLSEEGCRYAAGPGLDGEMEEITTGDIRDEAWCEALDLGRTHLVSRETGRHGILRRKSHDMMIAPIQGSEGTNGVLVVSDLLGDVRTFTSRDLQFLETLASQVSAVLENGRLEDSLAEVTRVKEDMSHRATHDSLTGLANRALLSEKLGKVIDAPETGAPAAALVFLDLDDFKAVNDTLGHAAGDQLLTSVARRLKSCCRPHDTVARLGGDEFAILLEHLSTSGDAITVVERIIDSLDESHALSGENVTSHASVGIAFVQPGHGIADVMRQADEAMYTAKRHRKGSYRVFEDGIMDGVDRPPTPVDELKSAIERGEMVLHYQPLVDLETGCVVGLEALVRWDHPQRGLIQPDNFIPLAEETDLIVPLGRFVLRQACQQMSIWHAQGTGPGVSLSVNLSPRELAESGIISEVRRALEDSGLEPQYLVLEITENVMVDPFPDILDELKALGVRIAVDDFGTGYSSLGYLDRLPIDIVKIDRSFVERVVGPDQSPLARIVLEIGDALGLDTVAEGIETIEQLEYLRKLGCSVGQGFLLASPMETGEVESMFSAQADGTAVLLDAFQSRTEGNATILV